MKSKSKSKSQSKAKSQSQSQSRKGNPNPPATYCYNALEGDILWQFLDLKRFSERTLLAIRGLIVADGIAAERAREESKDPSERRYLSGTTHHVTCLCITIDRLTILRGKG